MVLIHHWMSFALFVAVCQCWVIFHLGSSMTPSTHFAVLLFNHLFLILHLFFWLLLLFLLLRTCFSWISWLDLRVFIQYIKTVLNSRIVFQNSHKFPSICTFCTVLSMSWAIWKNPESTWIQDRSLEDLAWYIPLLSILVGKKLVFEHKLWP